MCDQDPRRSNGLHARICEGVEEVALFPRPFKHRLAPVRSDLQVRDDGFSPVEILATQRIGITKSADMPLRYLLAGNAFVSRR